MKYEFHPAAEAEGREGIRKAQLDRFPFQIIYRQFISVTQELAITHERRRPFCWVWRYAAPTTTRSAHIDTRHVTASQFGR